MNSFKRFFSSWQGWFAFVIALLVYVASPLLIRVIDPTAGFYDGGHLQRLLLAVVVYSCAIGVVWAGWQIAFPSTDKAADDGLSAWFAEMSPTAKWWAVQITFLAMFALFLVTFALIPV